MLARELQDHVKAATAPYKYPRIVDFVDRAPTPPAARGGGGGAEDPDGGGGPGVRRATPIALDHVNRLGWTALLEAIILGEGGPRHVETVRLIVTAGADVELADAGGVTPLAHAERRGFDVIAAILRRAGAGGNRTPARASLRRMTVTLDETAIDPAASRRCRVRAGEAGGAHARLRRVLRPRQQRDAGRLSSQFQKSDPWPVYVERGAGAHVWDVDGNEYLDFHNGFGVMCVGHANPVIAAAVKARMDEGTHFAAPTEGSIVVAEELRRRWGLPLWRFTNSGTESTMDAVHLARGATGNDVIVKIEGSYHGHHDAVMVSVKPPAGLMGERERPNAVPYGLGYPSTTASPTRPSRSTTPTRWSAR